MRQLVALLLFLVFLTRPVLASDIIVQPMPASDVAAAPLAATNVQPSGAWMWSLLVPGLGQVVMGKPVAGLLLFVPVAGFGGSTIASIGTIAAYMNPPCCDLRSNLPEVMAVIAILTGTATLIFWGLTALDAYRLDLDQQEQKDAAKRGLRARPREGTPSDKEPAPIGVPSPLH